MTEPNREVTLSIGTQLSGVLSPLGRQPVSEWQCGVCRHPCNGAIDATCAQCKAPRVVDWMRFEDGSLIQPGRIIRLRKGAECRRDLGDGCFETVAAPSSSSSTLAMVLETVRIPKELLVCALPDDGDSASYNDNHPVVLRVKAQQKDDSSWQLPVAPVDDADDGENDGSPALPEREQQTRDRVASRFCHYAVCGNALCRGVFRIVGGDRRCARLRSDAREPGRFAEAQAEELKAAQTQLAELKLRKATLKKSHARAEALREVSAAISRAAARVESIKRKAAPEQLWCPFCGWEDV